MPLRMAAAIREGAMKAKKWYNIQAKGDDIAEISIFGDIGSSWWGDSVTAADFKKDFDEIKGRSKINILINSPGGDVFDGIAIHNIIATERAKVSVEVLGLAASAASIIALAGSSLSIDAGGFFMIHNVWTFAMGDADDLRKQADDLDKISGELVNIYEAHSNLSAEEIQEFMDAETWFTAAEAIEHGFADEQVEHEAAAASLSIDPKYAYQHVPDRFRGSAEGNTKPPETVRELEAILRDAGYSRQRSVDIAAHGFGTDQRDSEPEDDQRDSEPPEEKTEPQNVIPYKTLLRMRENKSLLKEG